MVNIVIITAIIAWAVGQILKVVFGFFNLGRSDISRISWRLIWAGGMPSSHSAFTVSTSLIIGLIDGFNSHLFALSLILTIIVIYDRSRMNHIYKVFQQKYPSLGDDVNSDPVLKDLVGHTFPQILAGIIIGFITAFSVYYVQTY